MKRKLSWAAAISWLLLITILLIIPGSALPKRNWFNQVYLDKWVHIFLFALLVILWVRVMGNKYPTGSAFLKMAILTGIFCSLYGIGMELVQKYFVLNRSFEWKDILADTLGSIAGILVSLRYIKK